MYNCIYIYIHLDCCKNIFHQQHLARCCHFFNLRCFPSDDRHCTWTHGSAAEGRWNALVFLRIKILADWTSSKIIPNTHLGGGFNPFEKYARQIGSFPQVGVKIKHIWNHHPVIVWCIYLRLHPKLHKCRWRDQTAQMYIGEWTNVEYLGMCVLLIAFKSLFFRCWMWKSFGQKSSLGMHIRVWTSVYQLQPSGNNEQQI